MIVFSFLSESKYAGTCSWDPVKSWTCGANTTSGLSPTIESADARPKLRPFPEMSRDKAVETPSSTPSTILQNISPLADPAAAGRGDRSVVVFLSENAAMGTSLQRLDVKAMKRSTASGDWAEAKNVTSDASGDFNPAVALTSTGRAVAAWERIKDAALSFSDITKLEDMPRLLRNVEIAVATNDAASDSWSPLTVLTSNDQYDHQPTLATLDDGRAILAYLREPADGGNQSIVVRVLQGDTWSGEEVIASDLRGVDGLALAAKGTEAQLVVSRDRDNNPATTNDRILASYVYRANAWSARRDVTDGADDDRSPAVVYDGAVARVYWSRGSSLVTRTLPDGPIETVRGDEGTSSLPNPVALASPAGAQVLVWSSGSDVRARIRDPKTNRWSGDVTVGAAGVSAGSLSSFFTPDGMLHLLTVGTTIDYHDVSEVTGGQPTVIEHVATPGRSDLLALEVSLRVDLAALGETLVVDPRQPGSGEAVSVNLDLRNNGELPVHDVIVDLRRGESVVATTTIAGDWMPGTTKSAELTATYDATAPDLAVVVDPLGLTGDVDLNNNTARFSFANRTPLACFQSTAGSGGTPLTVTFDAGCSVDFDGSIAHYSWAFSDATGESGKSTSHTFAAPGTYTVFLTITDDMGASGAQSMTIDVAAPLNWRQTAATQSLYLSVVGRAPGAGGSYFVSDVAVLNTDQDRNLDIDAVYMPDGRTDAYHKHIAVGAGQLLQTRDVVAQIFEATNGTGSVRFDLSHPHAVAVARTYNDQPVGTAGFSNGAVRVDDALRDGETAVVLQHWLPGYRTNIGFTEIGGTASTVTATAFDEKGAPLGSQPFGVGAYEHKQLNGLALFQNRGRIELTVQGGRILAYVSTVDGRTGDPIYQTPERRAAEPVATTLLVPVAARLAGANNSIWRTDLRVFNPTTATQTMTIDLHTPSGTQTKSVDVGGGETVGYDDVIATLFPQLTGNVSGAVVITAPSSVMASSRTFNLTANGTYGLYVPARKPDELLSAGETGYIVPLQENASYRCNLGMTSFGSAATILVRAFDVNGVTLATKTYSVAANQNMQIGAVFRDMGITTAVDGAGLEITVIDGRALIYASLNDNRSGDGTFIEATRGE
jgi:PKD repeat protein